MLTAFKLAALILGILMAAGGSVMLMLAVLFGTGGIMDRHRRDRGLEAVFAVIALLGCGLLGWAALS